mmetsp:Transcript_39136/g.92067  ORF Transcript_39136/g.92067 Transcript_39136/m.92067 type:complete len:518 (-) Transcript_39136:63-1616(-)|eukprot:CAMPEP_0178417308 /NCGR_PEP_ID=MMETSP0689_2-20121128/24507_1 /TAXON_ID=160604 /ORGANISM="Amphidinium massartii, Strain CS-259" /LENGTH=517 /DNA_ID=CAMNT_0020038669 /DNA_START=165 /DNA_END=1718 /DNA_ORIENTATION=-
MMQASPSARRANDLAVPVPVDRKLYRSMSTRSQLQDGSKGDKVKFTDQELWEQVIQEEKAEGKSRITRMHRDVMGRKIKNEVRCLDVDSPGFIYGVFLLIMANSLFIGVEVSTEPQWWYPYVEHFFDVAFVLEITCRLCEKREEFFVERFGNWKWNVFDLTIVLLSLAGMFIEPMLGDEDHAQQLRNGYVLVQTIRMIRVVRVLRFLRMFRELAIIGDGFFKSIGAVGWITVMLLFLMYFCAVLTTGLLGKQPGASEVVASQFGSVVRSMLALFQILTLDGWVDTTRTVMADAGWGWGIFFCSFVLLASFTFLGLLSAVLTDHTITTMRESHSHKEKRLREQQQEAMHQVLEVFESMDADGSGTVSKDEMLNMLTDPDIQDTMQCMNWNLEPSDVDEIYGLLDSDNSGQIDAEEFLEGFMQLRGEARAKDLFALKMKLKKDFMDIKDAMGVPHRQNSSRSMRSRATKDGQSSARRGTEDEKDVAFSATLNAVRRLKGDRKRLLQVLKEVTASLEQVS